MSFIEDYDVIVNEHDIFYRRLGMRKTFFQSVREENLDEGIMLNFPYSNLYFSCKSQTNAIPECRKFKRAGIIPYTIIEDKKYFCLGVDSKYGTLTDFGGGIKKDEHFITGACRELEEESLGIFNFTSKEDIENVSKYSKTIYDATTAILFLHVKVNDLNSIVQEFHRRMSKQNFVENSNIMWIPEDIFFYLIKSGKTIRNGKYIYPSVYKVVNDLLRSVSNINCIV
jgi:hypothetical protein